MGIIPTSRHLRLGQELRMVCHHLVYTSLCIQCVSSAALNVFCEAAAVWDSGRDVVDWVSAWAGLSGHIPHIPLTMKA